MKSNLLQPVSGTKGTEIFPYIRKIDLMSSNSYILSGKDQIALIDPGALDDQLDGLLEKISFMLDEKKRPIVVYLTHSHLDHCFQLKRLREFRELGNVLVAAQEMGADALEGQDSRLTLAGLLGKEMTRIQVDIRLLSKDDVTTGGEREMDIGGVKFTYFTRSLKTRQGPVLDSQTVPLGQDDYMEIYSIPGHSPDSVCIRVGRLLFTGDLFFAPNPGMAGAYGWSQSDLLSSIQKAVWILEKKNIRVCCSGHGRVIDADTAWSTLRSMYQDVLSLSSLEEITPQWAKYTAAYAKDSIGELERLFTIIAGRLAYVSQVLYDLDEKGEADDVQSLMDARRIEEIFADFNKFLLEMHAGRKLEWDLVHKAGQIMGKLDQAFESRKLGSVLDQSLLKRANRILNDYTVTYRGFKPTYYVSEVDINDLIAELLEYFACKPYPEEAILEADDFEDYLWALRARIAHINIFEKVALEFEAKSSLPFVQMDRERFFDTMIDLLERITCTGAKVIKIVPSNIDDWIAVRIIFKGSAFDHPLDHRAMRFFERAFALCGGILQVNNNAQGAIIEIELLARTTLCGPL